MGYEVILALLNEFLLERRAWGMGNVSKIHSYLSRAEELWGILGFIKAGTLMEREKEQQKFKKGEPRDASKQIMEVMNNPE